MAGLVGFLTVLVEALVLSMPARAAELAVAPPEELLRVYGELRRLQAGDQWAVTENVVWKRDAATFTFQEGRMTFAAPVAGRVLAAVFVGQGTFELDPPTTIGKGQIYRFTKSPKLQDVFREAVFFFTDDSWTELGKLMNLRSGADTAAAGRLLASAENKYAENFNDWIDNQRQGNFVMRNLSALMLADLTDPSSRGFFLADFKGEHHGDLLYHINWNRSSLLLPQFANDEEVTLLHYNRGNYYEWWAGFHLGEEYAKARRPEHRTLLAHCRREQIDAEVSKDNHLQASAAMEFEVAGGAVRMLPLSLNGVLRISSITDDAGKKLSFIQEARQLDNDPWIILPEPAATGRDYSLKIVYEEDSTYDSRVIQERGSGLYYVTDRTSWFPSFGAFNDRTRYTLHFRSPKKFTFVATGRPVKSGKIGDAWETEWESEIPYNAVGFNYGDFVEKTHSDANLAVTAYTGREIPDELMELKSRLDARDLRRGEHGLPGHAGSGLMMGGWDTSHTAQYAADVSFQAFKLFEYYFGPVPFKTISVSEQPIRGYGQSWPTLIFLPYDSLLDPTTREGLRLQASPEAREFYNIVAVHEMAHQWWGHMVGWKTYHDQWLSEGFAEFSAALYLKKFEPNKLKSFWDLKRKWLLEKDKSGHRPVEVGPLWLNYQLNTHAGPRESVNLIYYKGAYVLETLRALMEDPSAPDPDARFIAMMRDFLSTYNGQNPSTEDFRRMVEKHAGEPMGWFFDEWVYGTEVPHYDFDYSLKNGDNGQTILHVSLTQSEVSDSFVMRVPLYAHLGGTAKLLGFLPIKGLTTFSGDTPLPFRPDKITLDESHSILSTIRQ